MGTAFDYALRWTFLARFQCAAERQNWVAEAAVDRLRLFSPRSGKLKTATAIVARARKRVARAIATGKLTDSTLESALELARLDPVFRAGVGLEYVGRPVPHREIAELRSLLQVVPFSDLSPQRWCLLNPVFTASLEIGGADADLLIDDMILEVKTSSSGRYERSFFNQLLGYYLLHLHAGIDGLTKQPEVRRLGLYFSRQGRLVVWSVERIASPRAFGAAVAWFMRQVRAQHRSVPLTTVRVMGLGGQA
jgi:hypothetical protein